MRNIKNYSVFESNSSEIFLQCDIVDKTIDKPFFGKKKYILTLRINAKLKSEYSNIQEYEVDMDDYYKVDKDKSYRLKFIEYNGKYLLKGSYQNFEESKK